MTYDQIKESVLDAYHKRDLKSAHAIVDSFIAAAVGEERGKALTLKAGLLAALGNDQADQGLALIEEALCLLREPGSKLEAVVNALAFCHFSFDLERAVTYELLGHRILQEHIDDPAVRRNQFRLHMNLGLLADDNGHYAKAYWHFNQGAISLQQTGGIYESDVVCYAFWFQRHLAATCRKMNRLFEAQEYLNEALRAAVRPGQRERWAVEAAHHLYLRGEYQEALHVLERECGGSMKCQNDTEILGEYYLMHARLAGARGDTAGYYRYLDQARQVAVDYCLHRILHEVGQFQPIPMQMGV